MDDEEAVREVVTWELSEMGYRVLPAGGGEEALVLYQQHRGEVSLVLLDLLMPGIGGAGFYRTLREHDPAVPVIVLSGYPSELGAESDLDGIVEWLQKPLSLGELTQAVGRVLRGEPTAASSGKP